MGFTYDEVSRYEFFVASEMENVIPVLPLEKITKQGCFDFLAQEGLDLPRVYLQGYPNANCIGCVKATSPTYWTLVKEQHPEVFESRAVQSRRIGAKLVRYKGDRIYLDELPEGAKGRPLKKYNFECSAFCSEDKVLLPKEGEITELERWEIDELL